MTCFGEKLVKIMFTGRMRAFEVFNCSRFSSLRLTNAYSFDVKSNFKNIHPKLVLTINTHVYINTHVFRYLNGITMGEKPNHRFGIDA